jgi:hypothetical protein
MMKPLSAGVLKKVRVRQRQKERVLNSNITNGDRGNIGEEGDSF